MNVIRLSKIIVFFITASFFGISNAGALNIERDGNHLALTGDIEEADDRRFAIALSSLILELSEKGDKISPIVLKLDIPNGGLADVSLNMANIVRSAVNHGDNKIVTVVEKGKTCTSGCTFIFLSGSERWASPSARFIFHGFSVADGSVPADKIRELSDSYELLLKNADPQFHDFFEWASVIENDKWVGFTGQTLFDHPKFSKVVTKLIE